MSNLTQTPQTNPVLTTQSPSKPRFPELDIYSGLAILFVAFIHSNYYFCEYILGVTQIEKTGLLMRFFDGIIHIAVPMFIFAAGFKYALGSGIDSFGKYRDFAKKLAARVLKPFLILSFSYILLYYSLFILKHLYRGLDFDLINVGYLAIKDAAKIFIGLNHMYQLWYIPMYLYLILSYPLIYKVIPAFSLRFAFFICLALVSVVLKIPLNYNYLYYYCFFEIGVWFCNNRNNFGSRKIFIALSIYLCALFINPLVNHISAGPSLFSMPGGNLFWGKLLLIPFHLSGVIIFYFVAKQLVSNKILLSLGKYSFFIFLFHEPVILKSFAKLFAKIPLFHNYFLFSLSAVFSILISIGIYKLVVKSGIARHIF